MAGLSVTAFDSLVVVGPGDDHGLALTAFDFVIVYGPPPGALVMTGLDVLVVYDTTPPPDDGYVYLIC